MNNKTIWVLLGLGVAGFLAYRWYAAQQRQRAGGYGTTSTPWGTTSDILPARGVQGPVTPIVENW